MSPITLSRFFSGAALTSLLGVTLIAASAQTKTSSARTPVLVELFTSEGCSSCPPADGLLAKLDQAQPVEGADIIALGEHVDYWDKGGWHDRFSSSQYTERQRQYGSRLKIADVYTPQMVIDGSEQFVGSDAKHILPAIAHSGQTAKIDLVLSKPVVDGRQISTTVSVPASAGELPKGDLYAALVDRTDTTDVRGGENGGRQLHHAAVVRSLQRIGQLRDLGSHPAQAHLTAPADAVPANMRVVVFAQSSGTGPVLAVASASTTP